MTGLSVDTHLWWQSMWLRWPNHCWGKNVCIISASGISTKFLACKHQAGTLFYSLGVVQSILDQQQQLSPLYCQRAKKDFIQARQLRATRLVLQATRNGNTTTHTPIFKGSLCPGRYVQNPMILNLQTSSSFAAGKNCTTRPEEPQFSESLQRQDEPHCSWIMHLRSWIATSLLVRTRHVQRKPMRSKQLHHRYNT